MSATIDERIVQMRFDNKQFESGVQTSLKSLDKLEKGLDLRGAAKGLEGINDAAKRCDISSLGSAVETVRAKFSGLEVMAMTALANITNSVVNAGRRMISSFAIEPITTGFNEYELKMGSIQTIMASTDESLDRVNQKLDELNAYSDRTIYSFSDMTQNIGKFTNSGVKLNDAVAAIKGVSNVAAVSGANANEASRAMYNFAQALSAGYVKLIDWKSIENANMATVEFKTQLLEAAVAAGTVTKTSGGMYKTLKGNLLNATQNFNDTLQDQWMTTEVLVSTLRDYADETTAIGKKAYAAAQDVKTFTQLMDTLKEAAQSGWAETWQLVVGDFEEAKGLLTEFSNFFGGIISASADARNDLLKGALSSSWVQLKDLVSEAGFSVDTFRETLRKTASKSVDGLDKMIEEAGSFEDTLSEGWLTAGILAQTLDEMADKAAGTTGGIAGLTDEQLKNIGYTNEQIAALRELSGQARSSSGPITELLAGMTRKSGRELIFDSILNACKGIQKVFGTLKGAWDDVFPPATSEQLYRLIDAIHKFSEKLIISDDTAGKLKRTFKGVFSLLSIGKQAFSALFGAVVDFGKSLAPMGGKLLTFAGDIGDWIVGVDDASKKTDLFGKAFDKFKEVVSAASGGVRKGVQSMTDAFERFTGIDLSNLGNLAAEFKEKFSPLESLGKAVGRGVNALGGALKKIAPFFASIGQTIGGAVKNIDLNSVAALFSSGAFAAIVVGVKKFIGSLTSIADSAGGFLSGITGILEGVKGCLEAYQNDLKANVLIKIAAAIGILALSLALLSTIDATSLSGALTAITTLFVELFGSMAVFEKILAGTGFKSMLKITAAMVGLSVAVLILSAAVKNLAGLDWDQLAGGLVGIGALSGILIAAARMLTKSTGGLIKGSLGLVVFAAAVRVLASSVAVLGGLDTAALVKGLLGVGAMVAGLAIFLNATDLSGVSLKAGVSILMIAVAVRMMASAVKAFGKLDDSVIGAGLMTLSFVLAELALFVKVIEGSQSIISTAAGILILGVAMIVFAKAVEKIGSLPLDVIGKGIIGISGALGVVALAVRFMPGNMISTGLGLLGIAAALVILAKALQTMGGMSVEEIAKGLVTLGASLLIIVVAVNAMTGALAGAAALLIVSAALGGLAIVMKVLGSMSIGEIASALLALVGVLTVLGVAAAVLTPVIPMMMLLGAALLLLGVGLTAVGAASIVLAIGLGAISAAGLAGVGILLAMTAAMIPLTLLSPALLVVGAALTVLSVGLLAVGAGLMLLSVGLGAIVALGEPGMAALVALAETAGQVAEFAVQLLAAGAGLLVFGAGALVAGAGALVAGLGISVLGVGLRTLAGVDLTNMDGLENLAKNLFDASLSLALASPGLLAGGAAMLAFGAGAESTGKGLKAISVGIESVVQDVKSVPDELREATNAIVQSVERIIGESTAALERSKPKATSKAAEIAKASAEAIGSKKSVFQTCGVNLVEGFIAGIQSRATQAANAAASVAANALRAANAELDIHSPSGKFEEVGKYADLGLAKGLEKYADLASSAASSVGEHTIRPVLSMTDSLNASSGAMDSALRGMTMGALQVEPVLHVENTVTMRHTFDHLVVEGVNNKGEFVASADYAVEEVLASILRRQNRL